MSAIAFTGRYALIAALMRQPATLLLPRVRQRQQQARNRLKRMLAAMSELPQSERANQLENIWFAGDNIICLASCRTGIGILEPERLGAHHAAP